MSLAAELLETAGYLTRRNQNRPTQADLRRAVSTAYYALFHLFVREATAALVTDPGLRGLVPRAFGHTDMRDACEPFASGRFRDPLRTLVPATTPPDLVSVAQAFIDLQPARHAADYDTTAAFNRPDTLAFVRQVGRAFAAWDRVKGEPVATVFLVSLLLGRRWNR